MGCGQVVSNLILGLGLGKWGTFIIMMLILFFMGMFIDWMGIVLIVFPIFLPIAQSLGFDTFWFVMIMAIMLQDSFLTPPFGYSLFYLRGIAPPEVKTSDIYWGVVPFWHLMEVGLIICILFPETITWLPSILVK
jgi:TRAP-type mannitol/chloroaromatic compound transport system permease large subunit